MTFIYASQFFGYNISVLAIVAPNTEQPKFEVVVICNMRTILCIHFYQIQNRQNSGHFFCRQIYPCFYSLCSIYLFLNGWPKTWSKGRIWNLDWFFWRTIKNGMWKQLNSLDIHKVDHNLHRYYIQIPLLFRYHRRRLVWELWKAEDQSGCGMGD